MGERRGKCAKCGKPRVWVDDCHYSEASWHVNPDDDARCATPRPLRRTMGEREPTATVERSEYRKVAHDDGWATQLWMIVCDEGWRESIVCERMYEWAADWLLGILGPIPFAPEPRGEVRATTPATEQMGDET